MFVFPNNTSVGGVETEDSFGAGNSAALKGICWIAFPFTNFSVRDIDSVSDDSWTSESSTDRCSATARVDRAVETLR